MSLFHDAAAGTLSRQGLLSYLHIHGIDEQCDQRGEGIFGLTALCLAARNGHADAVRLLLNQGANPDALTSDHKTALWIVTDSGTGRARAKVVELLLKYKANARYCHPDLRDGAKPLENELMRSKDPEVIQLLVEANGTTEKAEMLASRLNSPAIDDAMESTRWRRQIRMATVNLISAFILFILALVDSTGIARMVNKVFHNVLADDSINDGIQDNQDNGLVQQGASACAVVQDVSLKSHDLSVQGFY